jgi:pheromone a factor receptor
MFMAVVLMFWGFLIISFNMWFTMKRGLRPWISWDNVHVGFSRIALFPTLLIPRKELVYTYLLWWTIPISSVLFFGFFSFGQDAMKEYRACYVWVRKTVFRVPEAPTKAPLGSSLPS